MLLWKSCKQRVTALRRIELPDSAFGIDAAHAGIFSDAKRERGAALLLRGLFGGEKSPRDGIVDRGMQGIDAAGNQAVVRVEGGVLHQVAQIFVAAGRMGIGGAPKRLILDRSTFLRERHGEIAAHMLPQAVV